jgi:serine/threonine-protein kinase RsbT
MALERIVDAPPTDRPILASGHTMEPEVRVGIRSAVDVVTARQQARALASRLGFSNSNLTIIATAISEVGRNIVDYAKEGELRMALVEDGGRRGVRIVAADSGPGIADIAIVMRDGYSTGQGLGIGLPGSKRLMDDFEIESVVGQGTTITMTKWAS